MNWSFARSEEGKFFYAVVCSMEKKNLFRFSVSSRSSVGKLHFPRKLSIYSAFQMYYLEVSISSLTLSVFCIFPLVYLIFCSFYIFYIWSNCSNFLCDSSEINKLYIFSNGHHINLYKISSFLSLQRTLAVYFLL